MQGNEFSANKSALFSLLKRAGAIALGLIVAGQVFIGMNIEAADPTTGNLNFYISDGTQWKLIEGNRATTIIEKESRYYISASELQAVYGTYGFKADDLTSGSRIIGHNDPNSNSDYVSGELKQIWISGVVDEASEKYAALLWKETGTNANIFYLPNGALTSGDPIDATDETIIKANSRVDNGNSNPSSGGSDLIQVIGKNATLEANKTAHVTDWNEREYEINIEAAGNLEVSELRTNPIDVVLVLDKSGSMAHPDSPIDTIYDYEYRGYKGKGLSAEDIRNKEQARLKTILGTSGQYKIHYNEEGRMARLVFDKTQQKWCVIDTEYYYGIETIYPNKYEINGTYYYFYDPVDYDFHRGGTDKSSRIDEFGHETFQSYIYYTDQTPRIDNLRESVVQFATQLKEQSPDSRLSIISYTYNPGHSTTKVNYELNSIDVNEITNILYGDGFKAYGSTPTGEGLAKGYEEIQKSDRDKVVILFTDGEPIDYKVDYFDWGTEQEKMTYEYADLIKAMDNTSLYTIGLAATERCQEFLKKTSSGDGYFHMIEGSGDLASTLDGIRKSFKINKPLTGVTVTDVVTTEFDITDVSFGTNNDAPTLTKNADGSTTITWTNQTISSPAYGYRINVKAKEDYFGGNNVYTNVSPDSKVTVTVDDETLENVLPHPTVNVKAAFNIDLTDKEVEIFLGENTPIEGVESEMIVKGEPVIAEYPQNTSILNKEVVKGWYRNPGEELNPAGLSIEEKHFNYDKTYENTDYRFKSSGSLSEETTLEDIGNDKPRSETKYYLYNKSEITFEAPTEESNKNTTTSDNVAHYNGDANNSYKMSSYDIGIYTVKVIDGSITITKNIDAIDDTSIDGDPIFTYRIEQFRIDIDEHGNETETLVRTFYKTLRFKNGETTKSATINHLEKGIYKVTELKTLRYSIKQSYASMATTSAGARDTNVNDELIEFAIGYASKDGFSDAKDVTETPKTSSEVYNGAKRRAHAIYYNERPNIDVPTDTDTVKNSLKIGEPMSSEYATSGVKSDMADSDSSADY